MKTAEEKANEYVFNQFSRLEHSYEMQEMIFRTEGGFIAGYNEAMRWRDPKEELPEEGIDVFVKVIRSGEYGDETIYTLSRVVSDFYHSTDADPFGCECYYPAGNGGRVRVTVIGWRPIE